MLPPPLRQVFFVIIFNVLEGCYMAFLAIYCSFYFVGFILNRINCVVVFVINKGIAWVVLFSRDNQKPPMVGRSFVIVRLHLKLMNLFI